jgi:maltose alpha-D-glucosyltransferase / alpha-amylase
MIDQTQPDWYKDAVIYQLHIKAFFDANNDGIGDFQGLMQRLDYIQELGVTTIWVLPSTRPTARCATSAASCARPTSAGSG